MLKFLFGICGACTLGLGIVSMLGKNEFTNLDVAILYIGIANSYLYMAFSQRR